MTSGDDELRLAAEQRARVLIDKQLVAAGWAVQGKKQLTLFAAQGVAVRESIMAAGHLRSRSTTATASAGPAQAVRSAGRETVIVISSPASTRRTRSEAS